MVKVIYFTASFCQPCKQFGPIVERVCTELGVELEKISIDTDEGQELANNNGVRGIPTVILAKQRELIDMRQGVMSESALVSMLREWM